jgi:hypothetical protein
MQTRQTMRIVGRRKEPSGGLVAADNLLKTLRDLRGNRPFLPRGVYRFKTHEEADAWQMKMLTR